MTQRSDQIRLGAFLMATGHHVAAWRHPGAKADAGADLEHYVAIARTAEDAGFDMVFLADSQGSMVDQEDPAASRFVSQVATFEPITLLSAIASRTSHIGLVATATTTYYEPYLLARLFASLDLLSGGRAGWNLVTSALRQEAQNFNLDHHPEPEARYARAEEFADVTKGLWQSWQDDAFPRDKASGVFFDPARIHPLNHRGAHFSVAGPLNVPRSTQGHPVVVQAGSSEPGRALAARTAEVIFTAHQTLESAQAFYADIKGRLPAFGRRAEDLRIMPGVFPVVGATEAEALEKYEELQSLILPEVALRFLASVFNRPELLEHPIDEPLPDWLEVDGRASRPALLLELARREGLTARELHLRVAGARGHWTIHGTAASIVDRLEAWFDGYGADGFNIMPPYLPGGLDDFVGHVVPELQRRGRFRKSYAGTTLREHLGLPYPTHPHHAIRAEAAE
ncbi:LLM class flavin-dependent oxidoreductase [Sphingobium cloacae]|uniref:Nitrilotriacetate monooxygenase n=1 Tax=Sphingobium cloacae TaxID=120107 RepID=A0A1E1F0T9_9SPHN|nr:LLM class flavin-dependent oxidoreductase [Sphingobium cloacae]BAV64130.1 nitrilotriacetate monooxygenase [Sphingobium cloacae]